MNMLANAEIPQLVWWIMGIISLLFTGGVLHAASTLSAIRSDLSRLTTKVAVIEGDLRHHADHGKEISSLKDRVTIIEATSKSF